MGGVVNIDDRRHWSPYLDAMICVKGKAYVHQRTREVLCRQCFVRAGRPRMHQIVWIHFCFYDVWDRCPCIRCGDEFPVRTVRSIRSCGPCTRTMREHYYGLMEWGQTLHDFMGLNAMGFNRSIHIPMWNEDRFGLVHEASSSSEEEAEGSSGISSEEEEQVP